MGERFFEKPYTASKNQLYIIRASECHKWGSPGQCSEAHIYINDLPDTIAAIIKLFANDANVYRSISTVENV